ncbi:MAG: prephenate dehydrogenase/arogenate dehydrogenase family protein [Bacillota bacterium]
MWEDSSKSSYFYRRTALIGTGLIGGTIGTALRERNLVEEIVGYDLDSETSVRAVKQGAIDKAAASAIEAVRGADLIILAVPVLSTIELLKELLPTVSKGTLITDVGSTKGWIMEAVEVLLPAGVYFIGGHPMAGSEEIGIGGADPALLENAIYVLTPGPETPHDVIEKLSRMLTEVGAQTINLDPFKHDQIVAAVSHLPQITAAALVQSVADTDDVELVRTLAAGGFRDSTRIALGNPSIWRDICSSNRWALLAVLKKFKDHLNSLEKYLTEPNADAVEEFLSQARDYRRTIPHRGRGILPEIFDIIVLVRDTPGVIGRMTTCLGEAGINIDAIEILHVRELAGGSIRLGFKKEENQQKALDLLNSKGYHTHSVGR